LTLGGEQCSQTRGLVEIAGELRCSRHSGSPSPPIEGDLRSEAHKELRKMLRDPNPNIRIRAATAIGSFSPEKPVSESEKKGWQTEYEGVDSREVVEILKAAYGDQPIEILPSPGEIMRQAKGDE
jgi:hypothetical protein